MNQKLIAFNLKQRKPLGIPDIKAGDMLKVFRKIKEGNKERLQVFQGTVIAIKGGQSSSRAITIRKVSFGIGVELVLPLSSPQIEKIEFVKRTRARRAKLYYVRDKSAKVLSKKLKEIAVKGGITESAAKASLGMETPEMTEATPEGTETKE